MSGKLLKSTATVGSMTLVSRVLGLIRDMVFMRLFGATAGTDAFFVAFKIPNFLRRLFAEGAFSLAFVPVLSEYKGRRSVEQVRSLVDRVAGTLGGILFGVTLLGVVAAPLLVMAFAPGFIGQAENSPHTGMGPDQIITDRPAWVGHADGHGVRVGIVQVDQDQHAVVRIRSGPPHCHAVPRIAGQRLRNGLRSERRITRRWGKTRDRRETP